MQSSEIKKIPWYNQGYVEQPNKQAVHQIRCIVNHQDPAKNTPCKKFTQALLFGAQREHMQTVYLREEPEKLRKSNAEIQLQVPLTKSEEPCALWYRMSFSAKGCCLGPEAAFQACIRKRRISTFFRACQDTWSTQAHTLLRNQIGPVYMVRVPTLNYI